MECKWRLCVPLPGSVLERNGLALPHCLLCVPVDEVLAAFFYHNLVSWGIKSKHHETTSERACFFVLFFNSIAFPFCPMTILLPMDKISRLSFCLIPCVQFLVFRDKGNSNPKKGVL